MAARTSSGSTTARYMRAVSDHTGRVALLWLTLVAVAGPLSLGPWQQLGIVAVLGVASGLAVEALLGWLSARAASGQPLT